MAGESGAVHLIATPRRQTKHDMSSENKKTPVLRSAIQSSGLDMLLDEISERLGRGEPVDFDDYVRRYPQHAARLQQLQPLMLAMASFAEEEPDPLGDRESGSSGQARTLGDFQIEREIGRGGMGVVFEAE